MSNNYINQLLKIAEDIKPNSGVQIISVSHDDWCNKLKDNKKGCNCNPDVAQQIKE